jgi:GT2 family glycosyltransferase
MPSEVCFVVPSYQSRSSIRATLDSILAQETDRPIEVLVVESSPDDTAEWLRELYPEFRILKSEQRLFPGAARNLGARQTDAVLLAFLDADATAAPDWLKTLLESLALQTDISLIGGAVVNANPRSLPSLVLYWIEFSEYLPGLPSGPRAALSSSNLLVRRKEFLERGGFDAGFAMAEDLVLCRKWRAGLFFEAKARIFHRHRSTWKDVRKHLDSLGYWSGRYRASHQTTGSWLRQLPLLSFGLPVVRAPRIIARLTRSDWKEGAKGVVLFPFLTWGLLAWATGFYRGLRER